MTALVPRKTYSHLQGLQRRPDVYDIVTTRMLHDEGRVFEVDVPVLPWYEAHARASFLYCESFEAFEDPSRLTYRRYTEAQSAKEQFVEGLLCAIDATAYDRGLSDAWLTALDQVLPVLRFPVHGLQMAAAYVAHLAPNGRLVALGAFQCADELRRVQLLARRMYQLSQRKPGFGEHASATWQDGPAWQPLRKLVEELLVTYDWSEALIALQVVVKPMFDHVFVHCWAQSADRAGDPLLGKLLFSLESDCKLQREGTVQLITMLTKDRPDLRARVEAIAGRWSVRADAALHALLPLLAADQTGVASASAELLAFRLGYWGELALAAEVAITKEVGVDDVTRKDAGSVRPADG